MEPWPMSASQRVSCGTHMDPLGNHSSSSQTYNFMVLLSNGQCHRIDCITCKGGAVGGGKATWKSLKFSSILTKSVNQKHYYKPRIMKAIQRWWFLLYTPFNSPVWLLQKLHGSWQMKYTARNLSKKPQ